MVLFKKKIRGISVFENEIATQPKRDNIGFFTIVRYYYKDIIVCFVAVAFFNCTNYMVTSYMPSYLQQIIKLDSTTVSVLITVVMAVMIPLALMFGRVADRIGEKKSFNRAMWHSYL